MFGFVTGTDSDLATRTAFVSGGATGIGREIVELPETSAELSGDGLDVLVNNAANDTRFDTDAVDADVWDWSVMANLRHQFVASQAALRFVG